MPVFEDAGLPGAFVRDSIFKELWAAASNTLRRGRAATGLERFYAAAFLVSEVVASASFEQVLLHGGGETSHKLGKTLS